MGNGGGSFTARAMFTADFDSAGEAGTISGTNDQFVAARQPSDRTVELKSTAILERRGNDVGRISNGRQDTSWTIAGATAEGPASPGFCGSSFRGADADPADALQGVAGRFHATHDETGRMLDSFGATR